MEMVDDMPYEKGIGRPYNRKGDTYLHLAARHGNTGMCKQLVNVGEIDIADQPGLAALNIFIQLTAGLLAVWAGFSLARLV